MNRPTCIVLVIFLLPGARSLSAQQINPRIPPPPPPAETSAAPAPAAAQPSAGQATDATAGAPKPIDPAIPPLPPSEESLVEPPAQPSGPVFDPLHAQRSLDVGTFYFRKGAYDAAIDRFVEASNYQPSLAMPWRLLGEAYEKKHEYAKAVDSYNQYLQVSPGATDAARIKKLISDLKEKIAQESPKKAKR